MSLLSRTLTSAFVDTAELFTARQKYKADVDSATAANGKRRAQGRRLAVPFAE